MTAVTVTKDQQLTASGLDPPLSQVRSVGRCLVGPSFERSGFLLLKADKA
jgi:hypothetical protein